MPAFLFSEASPAETWRPRLEAGTLWIVEANGRVIAFLGATAHGDRLHIDEVDVEQGHQGQGVGRSLIQHVIAWARTQAFASVSLTTFRNVPWNGPFYASLGFVENDRVAALQAILRTEADRGLSDRCAMVLPL